MHYIVLVLIKNKNVINILILIYFKFVDKYLNGYHGYEVRIKNIKLYTIVIQL